MKLEKQLHKILKTFEVRFVSNVIVLCSVQTALDHQKEGVGFEFYTIWYKNIIKSLQSQIFTNQHLDC